MSQRVKFIVKGRVQGVSYRAFVRKHALKLGLTGYAKNLQDGSVEVCATGKPEHINSLLEKCRKGPLLAKVTQLEVIPANHCPDSAQFLIL